MSNLPQLRVDPRNEFVDCPPGFFARMGLAYQRVRLFAIHSWVVRRGEPVSVVLWPLPMDGFGRARFVYGRPSSPGPRRRCDRDPTTCGAATTGSSWGSHRNRGRSKDRPSSARRLLHVLQNRTPIEVYLFETPSRSDSGFWSYAAYANDSWRVSNRLTSNLGLRFDRYRVFLPDQAHPPGRFNRMLQTFPAVDNLINWNVLAPPDALLGGRLFRLIDCRRRAAEAGRAERIQAVPLDGSDRPARTGRACCPAWPGTWLSRYSSSRSS